jgi:hypothetical protein
MVIPRGSLSHCLEILPSPRAFNCWHPSGPSWVSENSREHQESNGVSFSPWSSPLLPNPPQSLHKPISFHCWCHTSIVPYPHHSISIHIPILNMLESHFLPFRVALPPWARTSLRAFQAPRRRKSTAPPPDRSPLGGPPEARWHFMENGGGTYGWLVENSRWDLIVNVEHGG